MKFDIVYTEMVDMLEYLCDQANEDGRFEEFEYYFKLLEKTKKEYREYEERTYN